MKFLLIAIVVLAVAGYGGAKAYIHYQVSDGVDAAVLAATPYADLRYSGISSTLDGELTVDEVRLRVHGYRDEIYIGRVGINTPNFLWLLKLGDMSSMSPTDADSRPEYVGIIAEDIRIPVFADYYRELYEKNIEALAPPDIRQGGVQCVGKYGHSPMALHAMGYEQMVMSLAVTLRQAEDRFVTEMDIDAVDMVRIEIEVAIDGDAMMGAAMGSAYQPTLHSLEVKVTDASLNRRIHKYCTELGLTPEQIMRAHLDALQYAGSSMGIKFDNYVIDPYKEYLEGKTTFVATAKPRSPVQLTDIDNYKPSDVPALLNLEAVAY